MTDRGTSVWDDQVLDGGQAFHCRTLARVRTEMSLQLLAYNRKRVMRILGIGEMLRVLRA